MTNGHRNGFRSDEIRLDRLVISESNVRQRDITADIDELAASMDLYGLQQPIVVQELPDGRFEILIGQRRYLAAKQLGWETIAARIKTVHLDSFDAKVISFSENVQRRDLAPRDKADVCVMMLQKLGSIREVARHLGITEQTVRRWLGYAAVPEDIKRMVDAKELTAPQAMSIAQTVTDERKAVAIARRIVEMKPPKRQRDRIIAAIEEIPEGPVDMIFNRAEEMKHEKQILLVLPQRWSLAMDRASRELQIEPTDIARDAVIEWLEIRRY